ncbi:programmed cell death protein 1 [Catharus ustulatus]|uniref:programmed cell death protein 1 n=1 Tax=Catharus ustulatus TaxID=91951 RepID=UPI0014097DD7|nr:programmed cell death protein 1 [Catharus ustulatus]
MWQVPNKPPHTWPKCLVSPSGDIKPQGGKASLLSSENKLLCGEGSTETAGSGTAHTAQHITSHPPGQGTERLTMAPGASKKVWGSVEVALAALCTILLSCGPMLTCCRQVTISPAVLTLPEGNKATFFCNISVKNDSGSDYRLNWYKEINHSQRQKTAEISRHKPMTETEKYRLSNRAPVFVIEILNLHQNDSGSYYCVLITFSESEKVMESNRSQLIVTAAPQMNATDEPEMEEGNPSEHIKVMLLGILVLAGVAVLLIFGYLIFTFRRGDLQKPPNENMAAKEEKPPVVSISTVDYGVLEFQRDQCTPVPPKTWPVEQTEYATIVFPEEKPVTPERGKKHLDERTRQLPSQPC